MRVYIYGLRMRPPGIGCQPTAGLLEMGAFDAREAYEEFGGYPCWGWAACDRELDFREVGKYELAPMELVTEIAEPSDMCEWAESYEWGGSDS